MKNDGILFFLSQEPLSYFGVILLVLTDPTERAN